MNVIEPKSKLVRAGQIPEKRAFKDREGKYFIILDMQENYFDLSVRSSADIDYGPIWVLNVQTDTLAIFDEDEMVEPVELEVNVKEKA